MRSGGDERLSFGLLALLPVACCGLPLLLATSIGLTALAWGSAVGGALAATALLTLALVRRRARARHNHLPGVKNEKRAGTESFRP